MEGILKADLSISASEYLEGELISEVRHELVGGEVFAMSGGSLNHNRISLNIASDLSDLLGKSGCRPYINDVKVMVRTLSDENYYYPDVVVTCDPKDTNDYFLESPTTIFEVLSPSTEDNDRKAKYFAYRSITSLQEYVLVSQGRREVTVSRRANGWAPEILEGDDFELALTCGAVLLRSDRIYRNVEFREKSSTD